MVDKDLVKFIEKQSEKHDNDKVKRYLAKKGYDEERIKQAFEEVSETSRSLSYTLMEWAGLMAIVIFILLTTVYSQTTYSFLVTFYGSIFTYWVIKTDGTDWIKYRIIPSATILFGLLLLVRIAINNLRENIIEQGYETLFIIPSVTWFEVIGLSLTYILLPLFLAWAERGYDEALYRSSLATLVYVLAFNVVYYVYWFVTLKRNLPADRPLPSIWLFLIPIAGPIILYNGFSKALQERTGRSYWTWFTIFFFLQGIDIPVVQFLINQEERYLNN